MASGKRAKNFPKSLKMVFLFPFFFVSCHKQGRAAEMAGSAKHLSCKCEDPRGTLAPTLKAGDAMEHTCRLGAREADWRLSGQPT